MVETTFNADLDMSLHAILDVYVKIDSSKVLDFITNLFK